MQIKFEAGNSEKYKMEAIWDSLVYTNKAKGHLLNLYYLKAWKKYSEEENIWEPSSAIKYLKKLISSFYKEYLKKPAITFPLINSALPIASLTVKLTRSITKQKRGQPTNNANKQARNWVLDTYDI